MKKILTVAIVVAFCALAVMSAAMFGALPATASDVDASSPTKGGTTIKDVGLDGLDGLEGLEGVEGLDGVYLDSLDECVVITTVEEAEEKTTDITQEERDTLLKAYQGLVDGEVSLPIDGSYAVREIVDISFKYDACRQLEEHGHKDEVLAIEGVQLTIDFDMGVGADETVCVMTYINGEWAEIEEVVNNGDGTVTCVFEDLCPVAFAVVD